MSNNGQWLSETEAQELSKLISALEQENAVFQHRILELMAHMEELTTERVAIEQELTGLRNTRLMRATEPLRKVYSRVRGSK